MKLYPFQLETRDWMCGLDRCVVAMDQGLGKTPTALEALRVVSDRGLVVCPSSLKGNWEDECKVWRPDLKPVVLEGRGLGGFKWPSKNELVILGYPCIPDKFQHPPHKNGYKIKDKSKVAVKRRKELKAERKAFQLFMESQEKFGANTVLIADESQYLKNADAIRSQRFLMLSALCAKTWFLTGTPMPRGNPLDLYGMLKAGHMQDEAFGSWPNFLRLFNIHMNKFGDWEWYDPSPLAHKRLSRVMKRLRKEDVLPDLPDKTISWQTVSIDTSIAKTLSGFDRYMDLSLLDIEKSPEFAEYARARRAIADSRIPAMLEFVERYESNDTRLIVFSAHRNPILELEKREGWECIYGGCPKDPQDIVRRQKSLKGIGITTGAGASGLNLQSFSHMLGVDMPWDTTVLKQIQDRIHRIGQKDPCFYTFLQSDHPVDRNVSRKLLEADRMIDMVIEGKDV